jgi:hypothetical protein
MILLQKVKIKTTIAFISLLMTAPALSQGRGDTLNYFGETGAMVSTNGNAPFWLLSNKFGSVSFSSPVVWARTGLFGSIGTDKALQFIYGVDIIDHIQAHNDLFIQQGYCGIKLGTFTIKAGRWEEIFGNQNINLSSGGILWSGNATPMTKISLQILNYSVLPFTKGFAHFKGGISHSWTSDNIYVRNVWLHHKYMYVRIGGKAPIHFEYGLHHFVKWGGTSADPAYGNLSDSFSTFLKVFFANGNDDSSPVQESQNAIGNHIGSHNLAVNYKPRKTSIGLYWQSIFEDASGMKLRNFPDGLWGFTISSETRRNISGFLIEFINTTDQSGRYHAIEVDGNYMIVGGDDDYFNHFIYKDGWTNQGMTVGTPLITSPVLLTSESDDYLANNRLTAFHLGLEGSISKMDYTAFYTFSKNYGTYSSPFINSTDQHSLLLKSTFTNLLPWDISMTVAVAADLGELFQKNAGIMLSFRKEGFVKWKSKNDN